MSNHNLSTIGGALLVAGTAIGGGMLGLPVVAGIGGFVPAVILCVLSWIVMTSTGLLIFEASLWMKGETNLVSIAEKTLGWWGKVASWAIYIFLFYCLNVAYLSGGGDIVMDLFEEKIPLWMGTIIFAGIFSPFVYYGAGAVDRLNRVFIAGLILSFFAFVFLGFEHIEPTKLIHQDWAPAMLALPIIFGSFGFQGLVPTLASYLNFNVARTRKAILLGSFIPLLVYILWLALILGIVPVGGENGLQATLDNNLSAVKPLKVFIASPKVFIVAEFFAFFALVTSFLGVSLHVLDFLADGLKVEKTPSGRFWLVLLVFLPPMVISFVKPSVFIDALRYAAGFGVAILLGLMPILMVWRGRYKLGFKSEQRFVGGKGVLGIMLLFILVEVACEFHHLFSKLGWIG